MQYEESSFKEYQAILCCPACGADLVFIQGVIKCSQCGQDYQTEDGIPLFFWPHDQRSPQKKITETVKAFYEKYPFPNYDGLDDVASLIERARQGLFAQRLDEEIPFGARILEVGCGTGQLSNLLSIANRAVFGTDLSLNSLRLAQGFKERNKLRNVNFFQMNLFRPAFKAESFDLLICNGVLHHTPDPGAGFRTIARLVKKNGYILIGLYHRYARLATDLRRLIFKISRKRLLFLDSGLDNLKMPTKREIWVIDQYLNPHESKHTLKEVLNWFIQEGFQFVKTIPKMKLFFWELAMVFSGNKNAGLFMTIGQKKNNKDQQWVRCDLCGYQEFTVLFCAYDYLYFSPSSFQLVGCKRCGLVYLNPRPRGIVGYYPPRKETLKKDVLVFLRPDRVKIVKKVKKKGRVLDIGCGHGDFLAEMHKAGWDVFGNDISQTGCDFARKQFGLKNIYHGDLLTLGFENNFFDLVTLWHTFEHMQSPKATLERISRILKDDGVLIIESPNFSSLQRRFFREKWYALNLPRHLYQLTPKVYQELLESVGLQIFQRDYIVNPRISFISLKVSLLRCLGIQRPPDREEVSEPDTLTVARKFKILWQAARFALNIACVFVSFIFILFNCDECLRFYCRKIKKTDAT